jgi:hypothetical protein
MQTVVLPGCELLSKETPSIETRKINGPRRNGKQSTKGLPYELPRIRKSGLNNAKKFKVEGRFDGQATWFFKKEIIPSASDSFLVTSGNESCKHSQILF